MCGICGKLNFDREKPVEQRLLNGMCQLLAHRGPNDEGLYFDGPLGLGHRRLSIIDIAGGRQPLSNEDDTIWIVFNGEIYNHSELRKELEEKGHRFRTRCDTETIVHAFEEFGFECVTRLRGMFAFAIWDSNRKTLFCARDRFGIKPLYYRLGRQSFSFASEVKPLLLDDECEDLLDTHGVFDYFTSFVFGERTMFGDIRRLLPSHWLSICEGQVRTQRYWWPEIDTEVQRRTPEQNLEALDALLREVVADHMMSEVPQGTFLSGGVDSSLTTILMSQLVDQPLKTFTISFSGHRGFDESRYAKEVADAYRTEHRVLECTPNHISLLPEVLWSLEEPLADAPTIALLMLCREASKEVTVVHCGDGGDEAFGGYTRFYWDQYAGMYNRIPAPVRSMLLMPAYRGLQHLPGPFRNFGRRAEKFSGFCSLPDARRYMTWFSNVPETVKHRMLTQDFLLSNDDYDSAANFEQLFQEGRDLGLSALGIRQYHDLYAFCPHSLLLKGDKLTMSAGIEGRYIWLDDRIVNFGLSLPDEQKMGLLHIKLAPRRLLERYMSKEFVWRKKQGFAVPIEDWFKGALKESLDEAVSDAATSQDGVLDGRYLQRLVRELHAGNPHVWPYLWVAYVYQQWRGAFTAPKATCRERLRHSGGDANWVL